uniref:Cap-19 n=1 Tax=Haemonchus contortus TaxID=6289 RepID=A0A0K2DSW7_HAECO|nr:cap-19 [Haemonchus contortus]
MLARILLLFFSTIFVHNVTASSSDCTCSTAESSSKNTELTTSNPTTVSTSTSISTSTSTNTVKTTATTSSYRSTYLGNKYCLDDPYMNDNLRNEATNAHNYRRSRLAQGMVKNKNGKNLPPASNMLKLLYHCALEVSSFLSASRCSLTPSPSLSSYLQENIYMMPMSDAQDAEDAIKTAIKHWWSPVRKDGGVGQGVTYTAYNEGKPISWFTRMAWATTQYLGCAVHTCEGSQWSVVCHYSPGGNKNRESIYNRGPPCSACPSGYFCGSDKLCAPNSTAT